MALQFVAYRKIGEREWTHIAKIRAFDENSNRLQLDDRHTSKFSPLSSLIDSFYPAWYLSWSDGTGSDGHWEHEGIEYEVTPMDYTPKEYAV
jgi:hypothetical protein